MIQRLTLVAIVLGSFCTTASYSQENGSDDAWIRIEDKKVFFRFHGEVFHQDGSPANDVQVLAAIRENYDVKTSGNRIEFEAEMQPGFQPTLKLLAMASDKTSMAEFRIQDFEKRLFAMQGIKITLGETREIDFHVNLGQSPVQNAMVELRGSFGQTLKAKSNKNGVARFRIPKNSQLDYVIARTEENQIGGYHFDDPGQDPSTNKQSLSIYHCKTQKIAVVDEAGNPIPNLPIHIRVATAKPNESSIAKHQVYALTTNDKGVAEDNWFPDCPIERYSISTDEEGWTPVKRGEFKDDVFVATLRRTASVERKKVALKLKQSSKSLGGFLVRMHSFQHPEANRSDSIYARTDNEGNFEADLIPGAKYSASLNDPKWISRPWAHVVVDQENGDINAPRIDVWRGTKVEIIVTGGPDESPQENILVNFASRVPMQWIENGEERSGSYRLSKWARTDSNGVASIRCPKGKLNARVVGTNWKPEQEIKVIAGEKNQIRFHQKVVGKNEISGTIVVPAELGDSRNHAEILLVAMDNETIDSCETTTDSKGNFLLSASGEQFGLLAVLKNQSAIGFKKVRFDDGPVEIELTKTFKFRGRLIESDGEPAANKSIKLQVHEKDDDLNNFQSRNLSLVKQLAETTTNEQGHFEFPNAPVGVAVDIFVEVSPGRFLVFRRKFGEQDRKAERVDFFAN